MAMASKSPRPWLNARIRPIIIFVTAFDRYAIRAFDNGVADYLLKPVERDRLERALRRARHQLEISDTEQRVAELQALVRNLRAAAAQENGADFETEFGSALHPVSSKLRSILSIV